MDLLINSLFILSFILFLSGIVGLFVKTIKERLKLRYYFLASLLCFTLAISLAWEDVVRGFNENYNRADCCELVDVD